MNLSEHTRIFKGYLDRVSLRDLKFICLAVEACWQEQNNGNAGSQRASDANLHHAVMEALGNALASDRDNIAAIISRIINREA